MGSIMQRACEGQNDHREQKVWFRATIQVSIPDAHIPAVHSRCACSVCTFYAYRFQVHMFQVFILGTHSSTYVPGKHVPDVFFSCTIQMRIFQVQIPGAHAPDVHSRDTYSRCAFQRYKF